MAKFMVMVNCKWMVLIESENACRAEHLILDDLRYGIQFCQAFSIEEFATDTFLGWMSSCETISLRELEDKVSKFKAYQDQKQAEEDNAKQIDKRIMDIDDKINKLKAERKELAKSWELAQTNASYYYRQMQMVME